MNRRAYFFSMDAFIAMTVLAVGIMLIFYATSARPPHEGVTILSEDLIGILSTTPIEQISNNYTNMLIENGNITNLKNTLLEQIGEFYVKGKKDTAEKFVESLTKPFPENYFFAVLINQSEIYSKGLKKGRILTSSKRIISGMLNESEMWGPLEAEVRVWQ